LKRPENIKRIRKLRKIQLFLLFFVLSFVVRIFITLASQHEVIIKNKLSFENQNKTEIKSQIEKIKIKTEGFFILYYYFFPKKLVVPSSALKCKNGKCFVLLNPNLIQKFKHQWNNVEMLAFQNDTLFLNFKNIISKKIKVVSQVKITPKKGYLLNQPLKITPDSVIILGEEKHLKNIRSISTQLIEFQNINNIFKQFVPLVLDENLVDEVFVNIEKVQLYGIFSKYTEIEMHLPILFENAPETKSYVLLPNTAKVTFLVKLEDADSLNSDDIKLFASYNPEIKIKQKAILKLKEKPNFIFSHRIDPYYVDFIINNKE
jgi:hypothetical protein